MTLGGLALAVGVLVDEATVVIESIHTHLDCGIVAAPARWWRPRARPRVPRLLSMLCVLAVFVPSFFMVGAARQLFVPLSLAVGFAMVSSYLLSSTLVPVLSTWLLRRGHTPGGRDGRLAHALRAVTSSFVLRFRWPVVGAYAAGAGLLIFLLYPQDRARRSSRRTDTGQFQIRLRAPTGTRVERTELVALRTLDVVKQVARAPKTWRSPRTSSASSLPATPSTRSTSSPAASTRRCCASS